LKQKKKNDLQTVGVLTNFETFWIVIKVTLLSSFLSFWISYIFISK